MFQERSGRLSMPVFQKRRGPLATLSTLSSLRERLMRPSEPVWSIQRAEIKVLFFPG